MFDVRKELGVKSVRSKVEKRSLERIGHLTGVYIMQQNHFFSTLSGKLDEGESFKGNMPLTPLTTLSQYPMDLIWSFLSINACKTQIVSRISMV